MGYRTNPDRILENIDRQRDRESEEQGPEVTRQATGRDLDTEAPEDSASQQERITRIFKSIERAYVKTAQTGDLRRIASRFQSIGDVHHHHARGDVTVSVEYLDSERADDVGMVPFEIRPDRIADEKEITKTSRPDVNALRVLRSQLRDGVLSAFKKLEPRLRDAIREDADLGHLAVRVTLDLRPGE